MSKIIQQLEQEQLRTDIPAFAQGDTVRVQVRVKEGGKERLQAFEGIVIAKRNRGLHSAFTVRKISNGEGVERVFQTHSPLIHSVELKRRGDVRRAKLYYLRNLSGKAARIKRSSTNSIQLVSVCRRKARQVVKRLANGEPFYIRFRVCRLNLAG